METKKICVRAEEACKMLSICRSSLFKSSIPYVKMNGCRYFRYFRNNSFQTNK